MKFEKQRIQTKVQDALTDCFCRDGLASLKQISNLITAQHFLSIHYSIGTLKEQLLKYQTSPSLSDTFSDQLRVVNSTSSSLTWLFAKNANKCNSSPRNKNI